VIIICLFHSFLLFFVCLGSYRVRYHWSIA